MVVDKIPCNSSEVETSPSSEPTIVLTTAPSTTSSSTATTTTTTTNSPTDNTGEKDLNKDSGPSSVVTPSPSPAPGSNFLEKRRFLVTPPPSSPLPGQLVLTYIPAPNEFGPTFRLLPPSNQILELQTIIRDKNTTRSDFKFYADRLIRLVIEESLNNLPFKPVKITTPTNSEYDGLRYEKGNCGVSIVRSGEAMECGLRDCCRSIRIGKILVESDMDTHEAHVVYARFPEDISERKVILMYPIMSSGNTVIKAVNVLREHLVREDNIILANLFCTPYAVKSVLNAFPQMKILTSEVNPSAPNHFGTLYFGTN